MSKKKKDRTPAEIAVIRRQRENRRVVQGYTIWAVWLAVFIAGSVLNNYALMWLAFALNAATLAVVYGLYEKALRTIANRPPVDYNAIRKMEKRELPGVGGKDA